METTRPPMTLNMDILCSVVNSFINSEIYCCRFWNHIFWDFFTENYSVYIWITSLIITKLCHWLIWLANRKWFKSRDFHVLHFLGITPQLSSWSRIISHNVILSNLVYIFNSFQAAVCYKILNYCCLHICPKQPVYTVLHTCAT